MLSRTYPAVLPAEPVITAVTLTELTVGPLVATTDEERAARQVHVRQAEADFEPLPFGAPAARTFGRVAACLRKVGRKPSARADDAMIAAVTGNSPHAGWSERRLFRCDLVGAHATGEAVQDDDGRPQQADRGSNVQPRTMRAKPLLLARTVVIAALLSVLAGGMSGSGLSADGPLSSGNSIRSVQQWRSAEDGFTRELRSSPLLEIPHHGPGDLDGGAE